ncbi:hypothetical protein LTR22_026403 [Elasticomyces elasticus]|nr:hypothetical protein LTR22_026403 [Elasticomyces elasticus]KAK4903021.1 hypothetical protein LTR49_026926 [Elasticomyces elasticus]KAK5737092.1 hypothetical protein LTS12_025995 [Elasticomyces elasticus]
MSVDSPQIHDSITVEAEVGTLSTRDTDTAKGDSNTDQEDAPKIDEMKGEECRPEKTGIQPPNSKRAPTPALPEATELFQQMRQRTRQALKKSCASRPWPDHLPSSRWRSRGRRRASANAVKATGSTVNAWEGAVAFAYQQGAESTCNFDWKMPRRFSADLIPSVRHEIPLTSPPLARRPQQGSMRLEVGATRRRMAAIAVPEGDDLSVRQASLEYIVDWLVPQRDRAAAVLEELRPLAFSTQVGL